MISGFNVTTFHDGDMSFSQHPNEEFANPLSHLPEAMQGGSPLSIAFIKYFYLFLPILEELMIRMVLEAD